VTDPEQDGGLVTAENFRRQLRLLKANYHVVSPENVLRWSTEGEPLPPRSVLLTCDDGLLNTLTEVAPILREARLTCLFFVLGISADQKSHTLWYEDLYLLLSAAPAGRHPCDALGVNIDLPDRARRRRAWWNLLLKLSQYDQHLRSNLIEALRVSFGLRSDWNVELLKNDAQRHRFSLLNVYELRKLADLGMSIGSHTLSHPVLSQQPRDLAWAEISESRKVLENAVGRPIWALAYPYGDAASVTASEQEMAERAGFHCAFMNVGGGFGAALPRFALPRVHVTANMGLPEFEAHVSGFYRALQARAS
jgi:peptidoglycan/xylan/chitin deacetylase (PgdA/CDA1 family)